MDKQDKAMTDLNTKICDVFPGLVVRKDLVKTVKGNAIVPSYVLEYLLGQYCATNDEDSIQSLTNPHEFGAMRRRMPDRRLLLSGLLSVMSSKAKAQRRKVVDEAIPIQGAIPITRFDDRYCCSGTASLALWL